MPAYSMETTYKSKGHNCRKFHWQETFKTHRFWMAFSLNYIFFGTLLFPQNPLALIAAFSHAKNVLLRIELTLALRTVLNSEQLSRLVLFSFVLN